MGGNFVGLGWPPRARACVAWAVTLTDPKAGGQGRTFRRPGRTAGQTRFGPMLEPCRSLLLFALVSGGAPLRGTLKDPWLGLLDRWGEKQSVRPDAH